MTNPTAISWVDPTANADGSPIIAGEITGYNVGVRPATGATGTYPFQAQAPSASTTELLSALTPLIPPGAYAAAVQAVAGTEVSAWSDEVTFTLTAPPPVPNPPTSVSVS